MDAIYSGRAAAIAFVEGNDCHVAHFGREPEALALQFGALKYIFGDVDDAVHIRRTTKEKAREAFEGAVRDDSCVRLALILLDDEESEDLRRDVAVELATIAATDDARRAIRNVLFSSVLPAKMSLDAISVLAKDNIVIRDLFADLESHARDIAAVVSSWNALSIDIFESSIAKERFRGVARQRGAFRILVEAVHSGGKAVDYATFELLSKLRDLPNFRAIVGEWTSTFRERSKEPAAENRFAAVASEEVSDEYREQATSGSQSVHDAYQNVLSQQEAISNRLRSGNVNLARKFAQELIAHQLNSGTVDLAAKSLCRLAQEANAVGQFSVQLEWAKTASELSPQDSVTHGHLADAYIFLQRYDEALVALNNVEALGDKRFAQTERARILRLQGRLEDALDAFADLKHEYGIAIENGYAWNGYAEVLRDMRRFQEAREAYMDVSRQYPNSDVALCGLANVQTELGELDTALETYESVIRTGKNSFVAQGGKAHVLKEMGRLDEALALYAETARRYPASAGPLVGQAHVLRLLHKYQESFALLETIRRRFPYDVAATSELVELCRDRGKNEEALDLVKREAKRFPWDVRLANLRAIILKDMGLLQEALGIFDGNVARFPYDLVARVGRADTLKKLRYFDEALSAYDDIIDRWPDELNARHSKAAVLTALNRFEEAERLLPTASPKTFQEWIASHVRGMILLRREKLDAAIDHFRWCLEHVPYARQRAFFQNALALSYLKRQAYVEAVSVIASKPTPVSNVLLFHAFAADGKEKQAIEVLGSIERSQSAEIIELSAEIARRFRLRNERPQHDESWLYAREHESVLLEAA